MTNDTVQRNLENVFSPGKDKDFEYFAERFEARLHLLKLRTVLLDQENLPEETAASFASEQNKLKEKRFEVGCELVQCLNRKSWSLVKTAKSSGTQAWKLLQDCFKSRERPRIHQLLNMLTNLRMNSQESMRDYLMRAEELQPNLTKNVCDQMLYSVVLKGLPNCFANFVTFQVFA